MELARIPVLPRRSSTSSCSSAAGKRGEVLLDSMSKTFSRVVSRGSSLTLVFEPTPGVHIDVKLRFGGHYAGFQQLEDLEEHVTKREAKGMPRQFLSLQTSETNDVVEAPPLASDPNASQSTTQESDNHARVDKTYGVSSK